MKNITKCNDKRNFIGFFIFGGKKGYSQLLRSRYSRSKRSRKFIEGSPGGIFCVNKKQLPAMGKL